MVSITLQLALFDELAAVHVLARSFSQRPDNGNTVLPNLVDVIKPNGLSVEDKLVPAEHEQGLGQFLFQKAIADLDV